jgi:hypothetical protein
MKTHFIRFFSLVLFLSGCGLSPSSVTDATQSPIVATPIAPTVTVTLPPSVTSPTSTATPYPSTPTFIASPLPGDLTVTYVVKDELWIWKQNKLRLLTQGQNISTPLLSDDGQWLVFRQMQILFDEPSDELWVVRTDGNELHRLVGLMI